MEHLELAIRKIIEAKDIVISGHVNPDGDSIGSLLALGLGIEKLGKRVYMISRDGVPKRYTSLPGAGRIIKDTKVKADLAIAVDCSSREILGDAFRIFKRASETLSIDHHEFRRPFCAIDVVDEKAAAVGELIYLLLERLGVRATGDIAQNLLTSIIVETNSFRLPGVSTATFGLCAELMKKDVDFYSLVDTVFWSRRRESVVLTGVCLSRCRFLKGGRIAWSIVRKKDLDLRKGLDEDIDSAADEIRSIKGVEIVILFRQTSKESLRVSLRSKGKINVASIAEHCGGGGHFDVAGCSIPNS